MPTAPRDARSSRTARDQASPHPAEYLPSPELVEAADVAVRLQMPLLLTGEPGVGKTQAAYWLAAKLGLDLLEYAVRSTATASDLFYGYNSLAHYHAAGLATRHQQSSAPNNALPSPEQTVLRYITFHALGEAILRAAPRDQVREIHQHPGGGPSRSVVLLDEIDKAPRDLPNDVLRSVETMRFRVPELGGRQIEASPELRPVVVATSNSERGLPDAFLRRCIYYHIPFPGEDQLKAIVEARLGLPGSRQDLGAALEIFFLLRDLGLQGSGHGGVARLPAGVALRQGGLSDRGRSGPLETDRARLPGQDGGGPRSG